MNQCCKSLCFKQCRKHQLKNIAHNLFGHVHTQNKWTEQRKNRQQKVFFLIGYTYTHADTSEVTKHARMAAQRNTRESINNLLKVVFWFQVAPKQCLLQRYKQTPSQSHRPNSNSIQDKHKDKQLPTFLPLGVPSLTQLPPFNNRPPSIDQFRTGQTIPQARRSIEPSLNSAVCPRQQPHPKATNTGTQPSQCQSSA